MAQDRAFAAPDPSEVPVPRIRIPSATAETSGLQRRGPCRLGEVSSQVPASSGGDWSLQGGSAQHALSLGGCEASSSGDCARSTFVQTRYASVMDLPGGTVLEPAAALSSSAARVAASTQDLRLRDAPSPGSMWHPELCSRPCIYFASGSCIHGDACPFCHLPHERRPPHLDKRNRKILKAISGAELYRVILPEVARKFADLSDGLPQLWATLSPHLFRVPDAGLPASRVDNRFQAVFRNMTIRQLLNILLQKLHDEGQRTPESDKLQEITMLMELERAASQYGITSL